MAISQTCEPARRGAEGGAGACWRLKCYNNNDHTCLREQAARPGRRGHELKGTVLMHANRHCQICQKIFNASACDWFAMFVISGRYPEYHMDTYEPFLTDVTLPNIRRAMLQIRIDFQSIHFFPPLPQHSVLYVRPPCGLNIL